MFTFMSKAPSSLSCVLLVYFGSWLVLWDAPEVLGPPGFFLICLESLGCRVRTQNMLQLLVSSPEL